MVLGQAHLVPRSFLMPSIFITDPFIFCRKVFLDNCSIVRTHTVLFFAQFIFDVRSRVHKEMCVQGEAWKLAGKVDPHELTGSPR